MKKFLITLFLCLGWNHISVAATLLAHYGGGVNPSLSTLPAASKWTTSNTMTYVEAGTFLDQGVPVWRVYDPGTASTNISGETWANLNYSMTFDAITTTKLLNQGWKMSGVLRAAEDVSSGIDYGASSNLWLGYIHADPNSSPNRWLYAFTFGKTVDGKTKVGLHNSTFSRELDTMYHEYSMVYDPVLKNVSVYIDGVFQQLYTGGAIEGGGATGTSMIDWGDNSSQKSSQDERAAYYRSIDFYQIPEPSNALLVMLGIACLSLARRRRPHASLTDSGK